MWRSIARVSVGVVATMAATAGGPSAAADHAPGVLGGLVVHVHDGDTIDVRLGERVERVRYIGIDAPEVPHEAGRGHPARAGAPGGATATRVNAALVADRSVRLELDVEPRDRYGRLLAYVWVGRTLINAELVARGYARAFPISPNLRHAALFATLEARARASGLGLWKRWGDAGLEGEITAAVIMGTGGTHQRVERRPRLFHCARQGTLVSYGLNASREPARPTERRPWRFLRISPSTPSIGCSRGPSSSRGSRRWCACPSISTAPTGVAASTPPR